VVGWGGEEEVEEEELCGNAVTVAQEVDMVVMVAIMGVEWWGAGGQVVGLVRAMLAIGWISVVEQVAVWWEVE